MKRVSYLLLWSDLLTSSMSYLHIKLMEDLQQPKNSEPTTPPFLLRSDTDEEIIQMRRSSTITKVTKEVFVCYFQIVDYFETTQGGANSQGASSGGASASSHVTYVIRVRGRTKFLAPEKNLVRLGLILKSSERDERGRIGERIESTAVEQIL